MALPAQFPYCVTWKADGTRALVLIMRHGVYLIDRSFGVTRTQLRFPAVQRPFPKETPKPEGEKYEDIGEIEKAYSDSDNAVVNAHEFEDALVEDSSENDKDGRNIRWPPEDGEPPGLSGLHHGTLLDAEITQVKYRTNLNFLR